MHKMERLVILLITILALCVSCADVKYELEIYKDGSANFSYLLEANKEDVNYNKYYELIIDEVKKSLEDNGFSVNKFDDESKVKLETKIYIDDIKKIDDFNTLLIPASADKPTVSYKKSLFGEKYMINGNVDLKSYSINSDDLKNDEFISENLSIDFKLKLPVNTNKSNADETVKNELTWKLKYNQENIINAEFEIINYTAIIIIGVILFLIVQFMTIFILLKRKKCHFHD